MATEVDEKAPFQWWKSAGANANDKVDLDDDAYSVEAMTNHRRLSGRQIQLLSIAGTVGAALFVAIGSSLANAGPLGLLLGIITWASVIFCVAQCQVEVVTLHPIDGSFIRLAGRFVDEAFGFAAGYNYLLFQGALVCFDVSIFTVVIGYWQELNPAILISVLIFTFFAINVWSVRWFGEAEFWFALGKVILILGMMGFTIVTMLGGNPQGDRYGFRYWQDPGLFNQYRHDGALGRFEGYVQAVIGSAFIIAGPEYISMVAGEAIDPRKNMPRAFNNIVYRLVFFFIGGALCIGIVVPYTSPLLIAEGGPTASRSPYVIAMGRMGITVLPDIVNALIASSIYSAANAYIYGSSRSLYAMAIRGHAPSILTKLNRNGNPYLCVCVSSAMSLLSYLSVSAGTNRVLNWWISLVTASQLLNWIIMAITWLRFDNAMKKQHLTREDFLPYRSRFQPFAAWYSLVMAIIVLAISGYGVFLPGQWAPEVFVFNYGSLFIVIFLTIVWKVVKRTKFQRGEEVDLTSGLEAIEAYTQAYENAQIGIKLNWFQRTLNAIF